MRGAWYAHGHFSILPSPAATGHRLALPTLLSGYRMELTCVLFPEASSGARALTPNPWMKPHMSLTLRRMQAPAWCSAATAPTWPSTACRPSPRAACPSRCAGAHVVGLHVHSHPLHKPPKAMQHRPVGPCLKPLDHTNPLNGLHTPCFVEPVPALSGWHVPPVQLARSLAHRPGASAAAVLLLLQDGRPARAAG